MGWETDMTNHGQKYLKKTKITPLKLTGNKGGKGAIWDLLLKKCQNPDLPSCRPVERGQLLEGMSLDAGAESFQCSTTTLVIFGLIHFFWYS